MKTDHTPTPRNAQDDLPPLRAPEAPISMSQVFVIVLAIHVLVIGGSLGYSWVTNSPEWPRLRNRIGIALGHQDPARVKNLAPSYDRSEILVLAIVARFNQIDARLNQIEKELRRTQKYDDQRLPRYPLPPTRRDFRERAGEPLPDPAITRIACPRPDAHATFPGPHT